MNQPNLTDHSKFPNLTAVDLPSLHGKQPPPVLVVGMHNSGTSILTEVLHKSGIFFSPNMQHYESYFFSNFVNDRMILGGGGNWANLPLLSMEKVMSFKPVIKPLIQDHWLVDYLQWGYDGKSRWGIKDPRICVLLPLYLDIFPEATVIHIIRDANDVAASLTQRYKAGVGVINDFEHWKALTLASTKRVLDYQDQISHYLEVSYEDFCRRPEQVTRKMFKFLDLPFRDSTQQLLKKVTPERIGSYQEWLQDQSSPRWRQALKSLFQR